MHSIKLILKEEAMGDMLYQHLFFKCDQALPTDCLKELKLLRLMPDLGVVITGKGPNWLYSYLTLQCQALPWVACFSVPLQTAIVVTSQTAAIAPGTVLPTPPFQL
jgi:CRISPR-associated Csx3 family protein